jgi:hypothetical protein
VQGLELLVAAALGSFVVGTEPAICDQENYGDVGASLFDCKVEYTIMRLRKLAGYPTISSPSLCHPSITIPPP